MLQINKYIPVSLIFVLALPIGCKSSLVLKPHRAREADMAPAAAEGRFSSVMERASRFEQQNQSSRDVHWYRVWRGAAMIGLGQVAEGEAVVDQVLTALSNPASRVTEVGRLRMFAYDTKARAALARNRPDQALVQMERALTLAGDTEVGSDGPCDRHVMLIARHREVGRIAGLTGNAVRVAKAQSKVTRYAEDWALCLATEDYPGLHMISSLADMMASPAPVAAVAPVAVIAPPAAPVPSSDPPAAAPVAKPPPRAAPPPPAPIELPRAPKAAPPTPSLRRVSAKYAPVDPAPWEPHLSAVVKLLDRRSPGIRGEAVIRTDGARRALRLRIDAKALMPEADLAPLFKGTVIFFERTRDIDPALTEVLISVHTPTGTRNVLASKADIVDLFVDRIDVETFVGRLVSPR